MRVLYIDGVAICSMAPSRASAAREGGGEASVGVVQAGLLSRVMEQESGVPTPSSLAEGHAAGSAIASCLRDPARSKNLGMYEALHAENRELPWSPVPAGDAPSHVVRGVAYQRVAGREGNASAVSP
jgi:hypothetical protein